MRAKRKHKDHPFDSRWEVNVDFTKSVLHGGRGAVITVVDQVTGKSLKRSITAQTKNEVRSTAHKIALELIGELK